jgi:hypothetical protein
MKKILTTAVASLLLSLVAFSVGAAEGGYSNYLPGTYGDFAMAVEPAGRLTLRNDLYYYGASGDGSVRSGLLETGVDLTVLANFTTLLYKPDVKLFGASYAFGTFIPIVRPDIDSELEGINGRTLRVQDDVLAIGDLAWIPLALYWNDGNLHTSFTHFIVSPTGQYNVNRTANTGLNYWSFDTNLALTYLDLETGHDFSFNLGYIYNTKNNETDYQTGQELHLDFALNQFFSETFAAGIQGFFLKQITGDSGEGALLGDFKAEAAGVGPAFMWSKKIGGQEVSFIVKWLHEFHAKRRLKGDHVYASFAMDW